MTKLILFILLLQYSNIYARMRHKSKIQDFHIETEKRFMTNRSPYLSDREKARYDLNMGFTIRILPRLYYRNKVTSIVGNSQFRFIGYKAESGVNILDNMDVYYQHFSGHSLDIHAFSKGFPEDNKIGVRWKFYGD